MGKKDEGLQDAQQSGETKIRNLRGNCKNTHLRSAVRCACVICVRMCVFIMCLYMSACMCVHVCSCVFFRKRTVGIHEEGMKILKETFPDQKTGDAGIEILSSSVLQMKTGAHHDSFVPAAVKSALVNTNLWEKEFILTISKEVEIRRN